MRMAFAMVMAVGCGWSQQPQPVPAFEAAVVKPALPDARRGFRVTPGSITSDAVNLHFLITQAYGVSDYELKGLAPWMDADLFSLNARAAGPADRAAMMPMLRTLLEDQFHLKIRKETRSAPVYALVTASGGSKLKPIQDGERLVSPDQSTAERLAMPIGRTIPDLIRFLNSRSGDVAIGRFVVDRTGLEGKYRIVLEFDNIMAPDGKSGRLDGDIPSSLAQQLGLKLQPAQADVTFYIIENAEPPKP